LMDVNFGGTDVGCPECKQRTSLQAPRLADPAATRRRDDLSSRNKAGNEVLHFVGWPDENRE
jgi:hypothetical protein